MRGGNLLCSVYLNRGVPTLGSSAERLVEPACELRLVSGSVVGVNDAFAGSAVIAGTRECYSLLRRFLITIRDCVCCFAAKGLQTAAHCTVTDAPSFLTADALHICTFLGQCLASPRLSSPYRDDIVRSFRPLYQLLWRDAHYGDFCITLLSSRGTPSPGGEGWGEGISLYNGPLRCAVSRRIRADSVCMWIAFRRFTLTLALSRRGRGNALVSP